MSEVDPPFPRPVPGPVPRPSRIPPRPPSAPEIATVQEALTAPGQPPPTPWFEEMVTAVQERDIPTLQGIGRQVLDVKVVEAAILPRPRLVSAIFGRYPVSKGIMKDTLEGLLEDERVDLVKVARADGKLVSYYYQVVQPGGLSFLRSVFHATDEAMREVSQRPTKAQNIAIGALCRQAKERFPQSILTGPNRLIDAADTLAYQLIQTSPSATNTQAWPQNKTVRIRPRNEGDSFLHRAFRPQAVPGVLPPDPALRRTLVAAGASVHEKLVDELTSSLSVERCLNVLRSQGELPDDAVDALLQYLDQVPHNGVRLARDDESPDWLVVVRDDVPDTPAKGRLLDIDHLGGSSPRGRVVDGPSPKHVAGKRSQKLPEA